jgi:hydrogenase-4 membrane subunit HyfE
MIIPLMIQKGIRKIPNKPSVPPQTRRRVCIVLERATHPLKLTRIILQRAIKSPGSRSQSRRVLAGTVVVKVLATLVLTLCAFILKQIRLGPLDNYSKIANCSARIAVQ